MKFSKEIILQKTAINNNCPECYSNKGLQITFKQKLKENQFYKLMSKETSCNIFCNTCNMPVYPINWTNDIEQIVAYKKRVLQLKPKNLRLKPMSWWLIFVVLFLMIFGILYFGNMF